jgi:hypothetical protein
LLLKPNRNYTVTVRARSLSRPQSYALVITGEIGEFLYQDSSAKISSGLSDTAKILIIIATILTFCLTILVMYIGFVNPARRRRINQAKELLRMLESVFYEESDGSDEEQEKEPAEREMTGQDQRAEEGGEA